MPCFETNAFTTMKHLLRRLFFWDVPAQGTFFALTFFFVCNSLWFTLYQMLWLVNRVQLNIMSDRCFYEVGVYAAGHLVISLYPLIVFCRALLLLIKSCRQRHHYRPLLCLLASMAFGVCGGLFCLVPFWVGLNLISTVGNSIVSTSIMTRLIPSGWGFAYLVAVLCMAVGGFFTVASVARGSGSPVRHAVSKPVTALWGVFWAAYLVILCLALAQSRRTAQTRALIEQRFGYPLSAEGLREYYQKMEPADAEYWKRVEDNAEKLPSKLTIGDKTLEYGGGRVPEQLTPDFLSAYENYCKTNEGPLLEMEKCFDSMPPLPLFNFEEGIIVSMPLKELSPCRTFVQLEFSRLRVFLQRQEKSEALCAYQRIVNCVNHLQREPFVVGSLVWLAGEQTRLEAMERLLESRLLTDDELQCLAADLSALDERIPVIHQQAMYTEATLGHDVLLMMEKGKSAESTIAFAELRFFYPQLWLQASGDKQCILQHYLVEDFTHWSPTPHRSAYILSSMLLPALAKTGDKFYSLTAKVRAMQALLRAEAYRREPGDFPKPLPDLPTDPFTDKPMKYRYGTAEISEYVLQITPRPSWSEDEAPREEYELRPQSRKAKVVQIWSVGPDGKDDGGRYGYGNNNRRKDDVCARIRLDLGKD